MDVPDVAYARSAGVAIAYQVVGSGPATVVYSPHLCSIDWLWRAPHTRGFLERLAERVRLIVFNPRGTGLSDRPRAITLETRMDDINAVLDDVSVDRVTLFGVSESANSCALYASTYPERCEQLVLFTPYVSVGGEREEALAWIREMREQWGKRPWMETWAAEISPVYARDPELLEWFIWMQRASASPGAAAEFARMQVETNIEDVLPAIKVPTLILYRAEQRDDAAPFAQKIPDVELQELPGEGFDPYGSTDQLTDAIVARALRLGAPTVPESILSTLLFTDLTDSTVMAAAMGDEAWRQLLSAHLDDTRREIARFRGVEVDSAGDGFFARFDGPARAIACARAIVESGRTRGLIVRAGVHTGECALVGPKPAGIAVHIGARVLGAAKPGEVIVSRTVRDLVAGSDFVFDARGEHELKGVPGTWELFAVNP